MEGRGNRYISNTPGNGYGLKMAPVAWLTGSYSVGLQEGGLQNPSPSTECGTLNSVLGSGRIKSAPNPKEYLMILEILNASSNGLKRYTSNF